MVFASLFFDLYNFYSSIAKICDLLFFKIIIIFNQSLQTAMQAKILLKFVWISWWCQILPINPLMATLRGYTRRAGLLWQTRLFSAGAHRVLFKITKGYIAVTL
jgi:hypothetical protein